MAKGMEQASEKEQAMATGAWERGLASGLEPDLAKARESARDLAPGLEQGSMQGPAPG
jgi:hypothetical protein